MSDIKDRIKNLLLNDRMSGKEDLIHVIKSQVYDVLSDFFELDDGKLIVDIEGDEYGYIISVKARALRVY